MVPLCGESKTSGISGTTGSRRNSTPWMRTVMVRSGPIIEMTGGMVARRDLAEARRLVAAAFHGMGAAWVEVATGRRRERRRDLAGERREALAAVGEPRHLGDQGLRIGVARGGEEGLGRRLL